MNFLQQLFTLPYAHVWIPGGIFVVISAGLYWMFRAAPQLAASGGSPAETETPGTVPLATASMKQVSDQPKEKRQAVRRRGNPVEVRCAAPDQKQESEIGNVLDRSVGGLRVAVFQKFEVGSILSVRPADAAQMVPWIDIEVRSCRPSEDMPGEFDLGCQFVKSPPFPILMMFG